MKFKIVLLTTLLSLALFTTMIQPQPIYAQSSSEVDPALKERLMKQYSLLPTTPKTQPSLLDLSNGDFGVSFGESDSVSSFLPTALLRVYFRLI